MKLACVISVLNEHKNCSNLEHNISLNNHHVNFYVIDGGSNDGTYEYLELISKVYSFKLFRNENDLGIYDSWNKCLEFVSEEYVCFCGADDYLNPEFSTLVFNFLNNITDHEYLPDVIYGNAIFKLDSKFITLTPPENPSLLNIHKYRKSLTFDLFHPGLYMKKDILNMKFDHKTKLAGDLEFFVRMYSLNKSLKSKYFSINQAIISYNGISTKVSKYRLYISEFNEIEKKYNVIIYKSRIKHLLSYIYGIDFVYHILRKIKWSFL